MIRTAFFANNIVSSEDDYKTGYYLSVNKGYLAVFYNNDVIYTSNIKVENLRNVDREMLEDGIKAESYEEVLRMLEDFGS